jgi:tRNA-dihydrouridine synthase B
MKVGSCELGRVFLAPLSGVADSPFRRICKRFGAETVFTEMVSAQGLTRGNPATADIFRFDDEERPIGIQLFGSEPERMGEAAAVACRARPDFVDLNFACPARKIVTKGAGCALMRDPEKAGKIASAVVRAADVPVTAKIRLGWDDDSAGAAGLVGVLESSGVSAVTVHGRTWKQGFTGPASWDEVEALKRTARIPIVLSGDIFTPQAAVEGLRQTGCDAVMVARGVYGRPWIFWAIRSRLAGKTETEPGWPEKVDVILAHLDLAIEGYGERQAVCRFRKHLLWYTKGLPGVVALRPAMSHVESRGDVLEILGRLGPDGTAGER